MKPLYALACVGFLTMVAPGCCVLDIFSWGGNSYCGADPCGCGGHGKHHSKKCSKHCRKCQECMADGYYGGFVGDCGCSSCGSMVGDCGCGGGGMIGDVGGGGCGCGASGPMPGPGSMPMPGPMQGPSPIPPIPGVSTEVAPAPPQTGSVTPVPSGMTQVSVEEFQRLPGVVISGPTTQATATQQYAAQSTPAAPAQQFVATPVESAPAQITTVPATTASRVQAVQQAGWAPTRQ